MNRIKMDREEVLKASESISREGAQRVIKYLTTFISTSQDTEEQPADVANEVNKKRWAENNDDLLP